MLDAELSANSKLQVCVEQHMREQQRLAHMRKQQASWTSADTTVCCSVSCHIIMLPELCLLTCVLILVGQLWAKQQARAEWANLSASEHHWRDFLQPKQLLHLSGVAVVHESGITPDVCG